MMPNFFNVLTLIVLLTITAVQWVGVGQESSQIAEVDLAGQLPLASMGWQSEDLPLGTTEAVESAVEKTLHFDGYVNRRYRRGELDFTIYAAYWSPGRMPVHLVASHTPDRCWTRSGWKCSEIRFKQVYTVDNVVLKPAEFRVFEAQEQKQYVLYWHLVEGKVYDYGERFNKYPHTGLWLLSALQQITIGVPDQYFVRVSSTRPFEVLWEEPFFRQVIHRLAALAALSIEGAPPETSPLSQTPVGASRGESLSMSTSMLGSRALSGASP